MTDTTQVQQLIEQFTQPVIVVNQQGQFVSANQHFHADQQLQQRQTDLLATLPGLIAGNEEMLYWQLGDSERLLTCMPMQHHNYLIKITRPKPLALAKRYHNLVSAINQMSDAIIVVDHLQVVDLINERMSSIFPFIAKHHQGSMQADTFIRLIADVLAHDDSSEKQRIYRFLRFKLNTKQECNLSFKLPNGEYYSYRDSITESDERIGLCLNETQFMELNEQLEKAYTEATTLSNAKTNFMAAMSHEVRTPINAIIGLIDLCLADPYFENHEYVQRMRSSAFLLLNLVNDVLDFTKFDAEKVQLNPTEINLREFCETLIENFSGQATAKNTSLRLYIDPHLPVIIEVDDLRLHQVLSNLLSNGLKFNDNPAPVLWLKVFDDPLTGYTRFLVKDNGIGIKKAEQTAIFDRFSQANPMIHSKYGGTGIGLSLCQKICQMMEGGIYVKSQEGEGSEFVVELPLAGRSASQLSGIDKSALAGKTLVTNDRAFFEVMSLYQPALGHKCTYRLELPVSCPPHELLVVNPNFIAGPATLQHYDPAQVVILCDVLEGANATQADFQKIHLTPIKLSEVLKLQSHHQPESDFQADASVPQTTSKPKLRVLVVEDNPDNMFVLQKQCEALGIAASFAMEPEDAVIYFEQQAFQLIISDYQMPGISGAELITALRDIESFEARPPAYMLILTADRTKRCFEVCYAAGADKVFMKPLTISQLSKLITKIEENVSAAEQPHQAELISNSILPDEQEELDSNEDIFWGDDVSTEEVRSDTPQIMQIEQLRAIIGEIDADEERDYLLNYAAHVEQARQQMQQTWQANNFASLGKLAHSLKSSALIIGASVLSEQCETLELACANGSNSRSISQAFDAVTISIEHLLTHLLEHCNYDQN